MIKKKKLLSLILAITIFTPSIISANTLSNKQLAGPPAEFDFMCQAQPEQSALTSKTGLIPVNLQETKSGNWFWSADLPVDSQDFSFMVFANGSKNWQLELVNPITREVKSVADVASAQVSSKYGIAQSTFPGEKYTFTNMDTGNWNIIIKTLGEPEQFNGFILVSSTSKYTLNSYKTNFDQITGHDIHFVTQSSSNEQIIEVLKDFNPIDAAFMLVTSPDGVQNKYSMYDDGLHGDKLANDGLFGGNFKADTAGDYTVQINATGTNPDGTPFFRTTEHFVPVINQTITMDTNKVDGFAISDDRLNIGINIENHSKASDNRYRIIAEVWGADNKGNMTPVSWISTITDINNAQLNIELDARWIAMSKTSGSFELRNLRIEDANHFIPLITQNSMELKIGSLPKAANKSFSGNITQEMLMGTKPVKNIINKSHNPKLLLVHGYCSDNVWAYSAGQFSNSAIFNDFNQNRSHDNFANRIKNFGAQYSSFGVVAHSQGGAASLHLYTYYWSGLDYSSGNRMIQSVGTPYRGTPIAGNLAALGNIFGVGCGYNSNLTTSGADSWLAGIPTWARNQVNYYTTSFKDRRWRYDYCSLATDMFLSDPEDGVTERHRGQLSAGINRGHTTRQCHTANMRDPAQTRDSGRNSTMSVNARR
ncbi:Conditioned medium factor [hydrothermal vent metagenome]|uniref:Conditioned medium factor n=1 Tax=hydrothermal vent metagenome TaxID=652676 RepID=A0A3B0W0S1_9ZZZZ